MQKIQSFNLPRTDSVLCYLSLNFQIFIVNVSEELLFLIVPVVMQLDNTTSKLKFITPKFPVTDIAGAVKSSSYLNKQHVVDNVHYKVAENVCT